jgi:alkyl hydroperoxide reductase subunit AhpF
MVEHKTESHLHIVKSEGSKLYQQISNHTMKYATQVMWTQKDAKLCASLVW